MNTKMIEKFQCPGCTCGCAPCDKCESFEPVENGGFFYCGNWSAGTFMMGTGNIMLGLPKGFNRVGPVNKEKQECIIRLWDKGTKPEWNHLNIPVWAMIQNEFTFVRTYCPRVNISFVDVIKGKLDDFDGAVDVSKFIDEID